MASGDILIDDFTEGGPFITTLEPGSGSIISLSETGLDPGHTIGGSRDLWFDSCLNFGTMPVEHDPEDGTWAFGGTQFSRFCEGPTFQYGRVYSSTNPLDINLELHGVTGVEVTIDSLTPGLPNPWNDPLATPPSVNVEFFTHNGGSNTSMMSAPLTATIHPTGVYLPISSLTPNHGAEGASLADIDGVQIWFRGFGEASQLTIREFSFVTGLDGDLNGDGFVGIDDLTTVLGNWNQTVPPGDPAADPSGDGFVGIDDLNLVLGNWNAGTPPANTSPIPEPATGFLLGTACLCLCRRRF